MNTHDKPVLPMEIYLLLHEGDDDETIWCDHIPNDDMEAIQYHHHSEITRRDEALRVAREELDEARDKLEFYLLDATRQRKAIAQITEIIGEE